MAAPQSLTFPERSALRAIVDHGPLPGHASGLDGDAVQGLMQRGLITTGSRGANVYEATAAGISTAERIVRETGDGPEDLKAMLSFRRP